MMEQYALEPCPFCGGQVELKGVRYSAEEKVFGCAVQCQKAGCYATTVFAFEDVANIRKKYPGICGEELTENLRRETVRSWNRRAE